MKYFAFSLSVQQITLIHICTPHPGKHPAFLMNLGKQGNPVFLPDLATDYVPHDFSKSLYFEGQIAGCRKEQPVCPTACLLSWDAPIRLTKDIVSTHHPSLATNFNHNFCARRGSGNPLHHLKARWGFVGTLMLSRQCGLHYLAQHKLKRFVDEENLFVYILTDCRAPVVPGFVLKEKRKDRESRCMAWLWVILLRNILVDWSWESALNLLLDQVCVMQWI